MVKKKPKRDKWNSVFAQLGTVGVSVITVVVVASRFIVLWQGSGFVANTFFFSRNYKSLGFKPMSK